MRAPPWRGWIIGALLAALGVLGGCSALHFAYNQGPQLSYWWLDRYADFDDAQEPRVRAAIDDWFHWHRASQLPDYLALLARMQADTARDIGADEVCLLDGAVRERLWRAFEHAVPALAEVAPTLGTEQLQHVERRFRKINDDFRKDYLQPDAEDRMDAAMKRTVERAEMLYGRLEKPQREHLARGLAASPFDARLWQAERHARQDEILALLRRLSQQPLPQGEARSAVQAVGEHVLRSPRAEYRDYERRLTLYNCELAAEVHNLSTPAQRRHAAKRLEGYAQDIRTLLAEARR